MFKEGEVVLVKDVFAIITKEPEEGSTYYDIEYLFAISDGNYLEKEEHVWDRNIAAVPDFWQAQVKNYYVMLKSLESYLEVVAKGLHEEIARSYQSGV